MDSLCNSANFSQRRISASLRGDFSLRVLQSSCRWMSLTPAGLKPSRSCLNSLSRNQSKSGLRVICFGELSLSPTGSESTSPSAFSSVIVLSAVGLVVFRSVVISSCQRPAHSQQQIENRNPLNWSRRQHDLDNHRHVLIYYEVIAPLSAHLSKQITPKVRALYADGDTVIALWDGTAVAKDGKPYNNNTYSWYMTLKNDRIVKAIAFFDTLELADIWERIPI